MKKVLLTTAMTFLASAATFAMASGSDQVNEFQDPQDGFYAGAGIGYTDQMLPKNIVATGDLVGGFVFENRQHSFQNFTLNAYLGYLTSATASFLLGAEVGYTYLPNTQYTFDEFQAVFPPVDNNAVSVKYRDYAFDFLVVAKYLLTDQFNVFAKGGAAYINQKVTVTIPTTLKNASAEKFLPEVALGAGYFATPRVELTAEYKRIFGKKIHAVNSVNDIPGNLVPSSNIVLVGANYHFNS